MADGSIPTDARPGALARGMPHDIQAEMGVLGSMQLSPDALYLARERLDADSFYRAAHQDIFNAILSLADTRNTVDLILLRDELSRAGKLEKVGGVGYLTELMESVPTSANAEYYIEIVRDHAIRRELINTATGIQKSCQEGALEADDLLNDAESRMLAVRRMKESHRISDMTSLIHQIMARIEAADQRQDVLVGLSTGFGALNRATTGFQPGEVTVVAARPSVGKTSLALNILHHVCMVERRPAVFYSLEVQAQQVVSNLLCIHNRVDTQDFRRGTLTDAQWQDLEESVGKLADSPLHIDDAPSLRIGDLRARARRMRYEHKVELIAVDYLQLLMSNRSRDSRAAEVAEISAGLKALARELEVPVLAVAQLNRAAEKEQRKPRMSDLRESGAIEQDADVVMLLHRPDMQDDDREEQAFGEELDARTGAADLPGVPAKLIIAKQRNGPTGVVNLLFWRRYLRFEAESSHAGV